MAKADKGGSPIVTVPPKAILAAWLAEQNAGKRKELARRVQTLATGATRKDANPPHPLLPRQLRTPSSPLDLPTSPTHSQPGDPSRRPPPDPGLETTPP